jgi:low affinity Fe/Cu permease
MGNPVSRVFSRVAGAVTTATGSAWAFMVALSTIAVWAILGPTFGYSDTWQLVINTSTTIITFLMVFVIQHSQNKEMKSIQIKLDELIAATGGASNKLIDVEEMSDEDVEKMYRQYQQLALAAAKQPPGARMSVEDAEAIAARAREAAEAAAVIAEHARVKARRR